MIYEDKYVISSCIIAEHRRTRPVIDKQGNNCPFCEGNESYISKVYLEGRSSDGSLLIKIINNAYPISSKLTEPYGIHDVVIDTPCHDKHPKDFSNEHWEVLLTSMQKRWQLLAKDTRINFIQIFKNYGEKAGASIDHSHWQIVALSQMPYPVKRQHQHLNHFYEEQGTCCLCEFLTKDLNKDYRIAENEYWEAIAPKVSEYAHETWLVPKKHRKHYGEFTLKELIACGELLKKIIGAYDQLYKGCSFNICFMDGALHNEGNYHFYIKMMPRLAFSGGFELATQCYINTVHPKTHAQQMVNILK